jgi:hypothetical protein
LKYRFNGISSNAFIATLEKDKTLLKMSETNSENNWLEETLENLENDFWGEPHHPSHLVTKCHQLRQKPLKNFEIEDLRIMIGQSIGLAFLVPLALKQLRKNILASGDFYEGDLLSSILRSDYKFWIKESNHFKELEELIQSNLKVVSDVEPTLLEEFNELKKKMGK